MKNHQKGVLSYYKLTCTLLALLEFACCCCCCLRSCLCCTFSAMLAMRSSGEERAPVSCACSNPLTIRMCIYVHVSTDTMNTIVHTMHICSYDPPPCILLFYPYSPSSSHSTLLSYISTLRQYNALSPNIIQFLFPSLLFFYTLQLHFLFYSLLFLSCHSLSFFLYHITLLFKNLILFSKLVYLYSPY